MRLLLRKLILWALSGVEPPALDPADLDNIRSQATNP